MTVITKGDFVVVDQGEKCILLRVDTLVGDTLRGFHEVKDNVTAVEVSLADVKANLGSNPKVGKVYGCNTERLVELTELESLPVIEWYFPAEDDVKTQIHAGLIEGCRLLRELGVLPVLRNVTLRVVKNTSRKLTPKTVLGSYKPVKHTQENPDIITVRYHPDSLARLPYLLAHEVGHVIFNRILSSRAQAAWAYRFCSLATYEQDNSISNEVIKAFLDTGKLAFDGDKEQAAWANIVSTIHKHTGLRNSDLLLLWQHEKHSLVELLKNYADTPAVACVLETNVTDYANTNPEEYFCETFAVHALGMELPNSVDPLFERTLAYIYKQLS